MDQRSIPDRQIFDEKCSSLGRQFNDLLDQLKAGYNYRSRSELCLLLDEVVERVDRRMVTRYGHGMLCFPHKQCTLGPTPMQIAFDRTSQEPDLRQIHENTQSCARGIVTHALCGAVEEMADDHRMQHSQTQSSPKVLRRLVKFEEHKSQSSNGAKQTGNAASQSCDSANQSRNTSPERYNRTNQQFSLRREARRSLSKYTNRSAPVDALVNTLVTCESDDEWEDARECLLGEDTPLTAHYVRDNRNIQMLPSNENKARLSITQGQQFNGSAQTCCLSSSGNTRNTNDTYALRSGINRSLGKFVANDTKRNPALLNIFDSICADMTNAPSRKNNQQLSQEPVDYFQRCTTVVPNNYNQKGEISVDVGTGVSCSSSWEKSQDPEQRSKEYGEQCTDRLPANASTGARAESSSEDEWGTPPEHLNPDKQTISIKEQGFQNNIANALRNCQDDMSKEPMLMDVRNMDSNLVFSVRRTLQDSLPKFTGDKKSARALLHLADNYLYEEQANAEISNEDKLFPDLSYDDLRGNETSPTSVYDHQYSSYKNMHAIPSSQSKKPSKTTKTNATVDGRDLDKVFKCYCKNDVLTGDEVQFLEGLKDSVNKVELELTISDENVWKLRMLIDKVLAAQYTLHNKDLKERCDRQPETGKRELSRLECASERDSIYRGAYTFRKEVEVERRSILRKNDNEMTENDQTTFEFVDNWTAVTEANEDRCSSAGCSQKQPSSGRQSAAQSSTATRRVHFVDDGNTRKSGAHTNVSSFLPEETNKQHTQTDTENGKSLNNKGSFIQQICGCN